MAIHLVIPRCSIDCNQLASLVLTHRALDVHHANRKPEYTFRVGVPAVFWLFEYYPDIEQAIDDRKQFTASAFPNTVQNLPDRVPISVNELAIKLQSI